MTRFKDPRKSGLPIDAVYQYARVRQNQLMKPAFVALRMGVVFLAVKVASFPVDCVVLGADDAAVNTVAFEVCHQRRQLIDSDHLMRQTLENLLRPLADAAIASENKYQRDTAAVNRANSQL